MRKKVVVIALVLLIALASAGFAKTFGVGAAWSLSPLGGLPNSAMLSIKIPQIPIIWGVAAQIGGGTFNLGLTADWWLYQQNLGSVFGLYVGPGLFLSLPDTFEIGARAPIGLNAFPLDFLELFIEVAPALVIFSTTTGVTIPDFRLQAAIGLRFWFDL